MLLRSAQLHRRSLTLQPGLMTSSGCSARTGTSPAVHPAIADRLQSCSSFHDNSIPQRSIQRSSFVFSRDRALRRNIRRPACKHEGHRVAAQRRRCRSKTCSGMVQNRGKQRPAKIAPLQAVITCPSIAKLACCAVIFTGASPCLQRSKLCCSRNAAECLEKRCY